MKTICIAGKNSIAVNCLKYLLETYHDCRIVCIVNPTDTGINSWQPSFKKYAKEMQIEIVSIEQIYDLEDLCFLSLEYSEIIKPFMFKSNQLYNIHFSKLPKYKGMYTSALPLLNGETETGVTLHKIDAGIDTGNIIDQMNIALEFSDNCRSLYHKYLDYAYKLFTKNIHSLITNTFLDYPQPNVGSSYFSKKSINYAALVIDFRKTAYEIHNQFRAFTFREYQMPSFDNWQIIRTEITTNKSIKKPGTIVLEKDEFFLLATIDYDIILYKDYYPILWHAAESGNIQALKNSLKYISDIDLRNKNGWNALIISAYNGHINIINELVNQSSNVNTTNYKGTTALMYAFSYYERSKDRSVVDFLINHGADKAIKDQDQKNIFDYMKERKCFDLLDL